MAGIVSGDRDAVRFAPVGAAGGAAGGGAGEGSAAGLKGIPAAGLRGSLTVPPDKSISHRAAIISSICDAPVRIHNFLAAVDTLATLRSVEACGVEVERGGAGGVVGESG
ncbi:MAG: hypothetical protein AAB281_00365, partial [Actinomycetota bacterium]